MTSSDSYTILLRLAGPLQAWGGPAQRNYRYTEPHPTKAAVIGMVANGLGRDRDHECADLWTLRFGVRTDRSGRLLVDYQTVSAFNRDPRRRAGQRMPNAAGGSLAVADSTKISNKHYLQDAVFTAALSGDAAIVELVATAIRTPQRPLYLGRRSCPPTGNMIIDVVPGGDMETLLKQLPPQHPHPDHTMHISVDHPEGTGIMADVRVPGPVRRYGTRSARDLYVPSGDDPMRLLDDEPPAPPAEGTTQEVTGDEFDLLTG